MDIQYTSCSCAVILSDLYSNPQTLMPRSSWQRQMWRWTLLFWRGLLLSLTLRDISSPIGMRMAIWRYLAMRFDRYGFDIQIDTTPKWSASKLYFCRLNILNMYKISSVQKTQTLSRQHAFSYNVHVLNSLSHNYCLICKYSDKHASFRDYIKL